MISCLIVCVLSDLLIFVLVLSDLVLLLLVLVLSVVTFESDSDLLTLVLVVHSLEIVYDVLYHHQAGTLLKPH